MLAFLAGVSICFYQPQLELSVLYALLVLTVLAHVHYGVSVVIIEVSLDGFLQLFERCSFLSLSGYS